MGNCSKKYFGFLMVSLCFVVLCFGQNSFSQAQSKLVKDKSLSFEFSPVTALLGMVAVELATPVNQNFTLGASAMYWNITLFDVSIKASGLAAVARYGFNGVYNSGWYLGGNAGYSSASAEGKSSITKETLTAKTGGPMLSFLGGYAWYWSSFYQRLGGTVGYTGGDSDVKVRNSVGSEEKVEVKRSNAGVEYNIGWTF